MQPVIIVGGGPVGLVSSILLSLQKIPHVLFERHPSTSIHPKACGLNQRTIEIFRHIGVEDEVLRTSAPPNTHSRTSWFTSLGPNGREIFSRDAWGAGEDRARYEQASPCRYTILPQIRLEPILLRRAQELNPDGLRFSTEVVDIAEQDVGAVVTVKNKDGTEEKWRAQYIVAADGGRMVADQLGIAWTGERDVFDMVSAHIQAPISSLHPSPNTFINWFINPSLGGSISSGYLYHLGPYPSVPATEEWCFACAIFPGDPSVFDDDTMTDRIRNTLELPDLELNIKSISHWYVGSVVTERFRSRGGKVFLVGDAAHRIPPWGALGLNTGIQDASNLVWKLAFALRGDLKDPTSFLGTYEEERRPIALRVARSSLFNLRSHSGAMDRALGISPAQTSADNKASMDAYFDSKHPDHNRKKMDVEKAQKVLDGEFRAHGTEVGWFYPSADIEGKESGHAGQVRDDGGLENIVYHPSTIPGHHLPHAWLEREGIVISTRDLLKPEHLVLLTQDPASWDYLPKANSLINLESINASNWKDRDGTWERLCGVDKQGAVLVRPDGIVAWRGQNEDENLQRVLSHFSHTEYA